MDLATPYRAPTFRAPHKPSADDLVEVVVSWGDAVLSVTHVRAGEGFAWEGTAVLRATGEGWTVTPPEGARAWALREGEAAVEVLGEGVARVLAVDERVGVALGEVTLRIARTAPPEALPRARGAVGFAAGVAFLLALVATGLAIAAAPEDDGTIARDDTAERAWRTAHVRPYAMRAPGAAPVAYSVMIQPSFSCCNSADMHSRLNRLHDEGAIGLDLLRDEFVTPPSMPFGALRLEDGYANSARLVGAEVSRRDLAENVRRVVLRHIREVSFCRQRYGGPMRPGRLAMRFVSETTGRVLAVGLASSMVAAPALEDCVGAAIRRWQFAEAPDGRRFSATVSFSIR